MNPQTTPATVAAGLNAPGPASGTTPADAIAEAMAGLSALESAPTRSHVSAFERVHVALTDALATIDGV
ncbi:MAG TPA: hypothetical protein VL595_32950 [Pseudonocardia sp.]|jgi:hypothetical protein|nr:hypothetical protein [Pseudonocardia sp.]